MSLPSHGANPELLLKKLGKNIPETILDFSENTNPFGPPALFNHLSMECLQQTIRAYPDPNVTELTNELAFLNQVSVNELLVGNGAAELIFLIAHLFQGKHVAIVEPAFSEYRDACQAFGCQVTSIVLPPPWQLDVDLICCTLHEINVLFLCSPNNPTGVQYDEKEVISLLEEAEKHGVYVVLDEAFYDFCEEKAGLEHLLKRFSHLILIRSLTKMFAIAGVRLGYMMSNVQIINKLKSYQPPWSVNGLAQLIGLRVIQQKEFVRQTVVKLHEERRRVTRRLRDLDYFVPDSSVNFYLLAEKERKDLFDLFHFLADKGIITRHTYNFNGLDGHYLRIAVKESGSNDYLIETLSKWRAK
jgi:threonine-phosphate decarboxylase